jgi:cell division protein FtsW (lipid II flippase)
VATVAPYPARPGRGAELVLLLGALGASVYAFAQVSWATTGGLSPQFVRLTVALCGLALILHVLLRLRAAYADPVILPVAVLLNGTGLAMIYRLSVRYEESNPDFAGIASRQLIWTAIGVTAAVLVLGFLRDHRTLRRFTYTAMVLGLVGVILPLVPKLGQEIGGARIWIHVAGMSFQPAEVSKILLAVFFAGYLVTRRETLALAGPKVLGLRLPRVRDMGPIMAAWAASVAVLVLEKDLGTSLLFFGLFVAILYIATDRPSWIVIGLGLFATGVVFAWRAFAHVQTRVETWLDPFADYDAAGYQLSNGLFGLANGGLMGTGWGEGRPDLTPLAFSDFIVASLGEELGMTGLFALLALFALLVQRGMRAATGVRDGFGKLLASGLAFAIALQVFVVVGGVTRLIPLTGLTTPFLAAGGSSLVANWMIVALLLRVSDGARRPPPATHEIDTSGITEAPGAREAA